MKPPISSPDGTIIRGEEFEFDGKERSVSYRETAISCFRTQMKCNLLIPYRWIVQAVTCLILVALILWPVMALPHKALGFWDSPIGAAFFCLMGQVTTIIAVPILSVIRLFSRGSNEMTSVDSEGVGFVAKRLSVSFVWKRVLWIINWSGDVFILTFNGGVLIPRHAFRSRQEAEDFIFAARQFHRLSRESKRPQK